MIDDKDLDRAFADSNLSPSCSRIAVKRDGMEASACRDRSASSDGDCPEPGT
jgi:hypothetical protein